MDRWEHNIYFTVTQALEGICPQFGNLHKDIATNLVEKERFDRPRKRFPK